jgi:hypothetical protein
MTTTLTNALPGGGDPLARLAARLRRATGVTLKPHVLPALLDEGGATLADIALMVKAATDRAGPFEWIADCNDHNGDRGRDHSPDRYKVRAAVLSAFQQTDNFMGRVASARRHYGSGEQLAANRERIYREANARAIREKEARAVFAELVASGVMPTIAHELPGDPEESEH